MREGLSFVAGPSFMRSVVLSSILFVALQCLSGSALALEGRIEADGPDLVLKLDDGRILRREALVGLRLMLATRDSRAEVRIDSVDMDAVAIGSPIPLYALTLVGPDVTPGNFCQPDPHGRRAGFPIPDGAGGFSFTCTSGAEGKCVLMGYRPWETRDGVPLRDLHRACMHMLRADYGGDDRPTTRNGTASTSMTGSESRSRRCARTGIRGGLGPGWCGLRRPSSHRRETLPWQRSGHALPDLSEPARPGSCTEDAMRADPRALLFNRSAGADVSRRN